MVRKQIRETIEQVMDQLTDEEKLEETQKQSRTTFEDETSHDPVWEGRTQP